MITGAATASSHAAQQPRSAPRCISESRAASPPLIEDGVTTEQFLKAAGVGSAQIAKLIELGYKPGHPLSVLDRADRDKVGIKVFEWFEICEKIKVLLENVKAASK